MKLTNLPKITTVEKAIREYNITKITREAYYFSWVKLTPKIFELQLKFGQKTLIPSLLNFEGKYSDFANSEKKLREIYIDLMVKSYDLKILADYQLLTTAYFAQAYISSLEGSYYKNDRIIAFSRYHKDRRDRGIFQYYSTIESLEETYNNSF